MVVVRMAGVADAWAAPVPNDKSKTLRGVRPGPVGCGAGEDCQPPLTSAQAMQQPGCCGKRGTLSRRSGVPARGEPAPGAVKDTALPSPGPSLLTKTSPDAINFPLLAGRNYHCHCGQPVFFRNSKCLACDTPLGYECDLGIMLPLMKGPRQGTWQEWQEGAAPVEPDDETQPPSLEDIPGQESAERSEPAQGQAQAMSLSQEAGAQVYKRCLNLSTPASCNWLIRIEDTQDMCRACRLNRTIPDLTDPNEPDNGYLWGLVELAKRRLVSALILLKLPVASRMNEDTERGLMFDFLRSPVNGPHVMTGHNTGLITLNVDEADDAKREAVRKAMHEPYRTLLGHFRHEVGHYYWDRLIRGTSWLDGFHQLFGDENQDYAASLKRNYDEGPPSDWPDHFVSAYASSHPWEDWAECWAHYLHMRDAIDTALSFGLNMEWFNLEYTPFTIDALYQPDHPDADRFLTFINHWARLTTMLNEMSRSMGQPDFYPFVLPNDVVGKLHFIHLLVTSESWLADAHADHG
jgi:hypothetical protein